MLRWRKDGWDSRLALLGGSRLQERLQAADESLGQPVIAACTMTHLINSSRKGEGRDMQMKQKKTDLGKADEKEEVADCRVACLLDVCPASTGSKNGAALQLYAFHSFAVQDYWLLLAVVETLVAIPSPQHEAHH